VSFQFSLLFLAIAVLPCAYDHALTTRDFRLAYGHRHGVEHNIHRTLYQSDHARDGQAHRGLQPSQLPSVLQVHVHLRHPDHLRL